MAQTQAAQTQAHHPSSSNLCRSLSSLLSLACLVMILASPAFARATPSTHSLVDVETKTMPWVDNQALLAADTLSDPTAPLRVAEVLPLFVNPESDGSWDALEDGSWLWRLRISSAGAHFLNLGFTRYQMPVGGQMLIYSVNQDFVLGPYGAQSNEPGGQLWTPLVPGDDLVLEVRLPALLRQAFDLELRYVNHGYRPLAGNLEEAMACHGELDCPAWHGLLASSSPQLNQLASQNTGSTQRGIDTAGCDDVVPPAPCTTDVDTICMLDDRFAVEVDFSTFDDPTVQNGLAVTEVTSSDSGLFYFFNENNWEFLVKMVDGCTFNDGFWVFAAATTNLQYTLRVTDSETGCVRNYFNPLGQSAPAITDTGAFATCP